jgi:hypothetical protein
MLFAALALSTCTLKLKMGCRLECVFLTEYLYWKSPWPDGVTITETAAVAPFWSSNPKSLAENVQ